jgi:hypothetical protein
MIPTCIASEIQKRLLCVLSSPFDFMSRKHRALIFCASNIDTINYCQKMKNISSLKITLQCYFCCCCCSIYLVIDKEMGERLEVEVEQFVGMSRFGWEHEG